jgi:hypothetical protein
MTQRERSIPDDASSTGASDDDTIALELSVDEMRALSAVAANETIHFEVQLEKAPAPPLMHVVPCETRDARISADKQPHRARIAAAAGAASAFIILISVAYLGATPSETSDVDVVSVPAASTTETAARNVAPETHLASATVRFANPFDAAEVFEFPPGTSEIDARNAVADLLLQRARDRHESWSKMQGRPRKPADHRRQLTVTASNQRS